MFGSWISFVVWWWCLCWLLLAVAVVWDVWLITALGGPVYCGGI